MHPLVRISLLALALAAGCGQKGPLTLKPLHAKSPVGASASTPAATPAPTSPATTTPVADEQKDPADDKPPAPRR